jgi:hypothetical protein
MKYSHRLAATGAIMVLLMFNACATTYPNRLPLGEAFPEVSGQSLAGEEKDIPAVFSGDTVILLIAYKMDSQFDVDRWLIGLDMHAVENKVYELPTIQGLFPRMFQTTIYNGMRKGIPKELWGGVITIYADGARVQEFTGNENPNNTRVIVLNEQGQIIYYHDRGFSVLALKELLRVLGEKQAEPTR